MKRPTLEEVVEAVSPYLKDFGGFEPVSWLENHDNVALTDEKGNVSLFEKGSDGVYTGHYFFVVRGKAALVLAREMLDVFFEESGAKAIRGLTPLTNLGARWMSRQLGFKGYGVVHTLTGPCELFILTKER
jgi:hypothetical protein